MKRKLRLLVAVVLTLAMVMGMSVTTLADPTLVEVGRITIHIDTDAFCPGCWPADVISVTGDGIDFEESLIGLYDVDTEIYDNLVIAGHRYSLHMQLCFNDGRYVSGSTFSNCECNVGVDSIELIGFDWEEPKHDSTDQLFIMTNMFYPVETPIPSPTPVKKESSVMVAVDHDTFKSEAPSKTVIASNTLGAKSLFDLKVHAADDRTKANQAFLVQNYIGANAKILLTEDIYPRRDLSTIENGSLQTLTWTNLPKNQAGAIKAVVYNQTDKAYVINGTLDANGTAVFTGFKLRPASTITICK